MLPTIGLMVGAVGVMIGFYIITRMNHLATSSDGSRFLPMLTAVVALVGMLALVVLSLNLIGASTGLVGPDTAQHGWVPDARP